MFTFKQFTIDDSHCAMKVGTDGVLLGAWADVSAARRVLDIGSGSGLIALMAAQRCPQAHVTGVELDPAAARDARANVEASPWAGRVEIVCDDVTAFARRVDAGEGQRYDCLLANPPYHAEDLLPPSALRAAARHTAGGGLTFEALLVAADRLIDRTAPAASLSVVLPTAAVARFVPLAATHGLYLTRRTAVVTRPGKPAKRTLLELRPEAAPPRLSELVLLTPDGSRSPAYASLCEAFYIR